MHYICSFLKYFHLQVKNFQCEIIHSCLLIYFIAIDDNVIAQYRFKLTKFKIANSTPAPVVSLLQKLL